MLRGRYSSSPESMFDYDIRLISAHSVMQYCNSVIPTELPDSFWTGMLPQLMTTSVNATVLGLGRCQDGEDHCRFAVLNRYQPMVTAKKAKEAKGGAAV